MAKGSLSRVRTTVESISQRSQSLESIADQSLPDVFASFSSADLIRNDIADMSVFDELENDVVASKDDIQSINLSANAPATDGNPQPSTSGQANQSSLLLQPFRNFFDSFTSAGLPTPTPQEASAPKD